MRRVFAAHGLRLFDVEELPTHGGSLRIYGCHADDPRDAAASARAELLERERAAGFTTLETYLRLRQRGDRGQAPDPRVPDRPQARRASAIVGYGAPAKGNTLLNYCGVAHGLPRLHVRPEPAQAGPPPARHAHPDPLARRAHASDKPDVVLILPWNIKDEIMEQLAYIREWGGRSPRARRSCSCSHEVRRDAAARARGVVEPERLARRARLLRAHVRRERVRGAGLDRAVVQCSTSFNARAGTLRGLHYQAAPHGEAQARALHARRDLRRRRRPAARLADATASWFGVELSADNAARAVRPEGFAHGFQTLADDTEVLYLMGHDVRARGRRAACAGTTRRSGSTGRTAAGGARSPSATPATRTSRP